MYRREAAAWQIFTSGQEVVGAVDGKAGRAQWEFAYNVRFRSDQGSGPHVMPQVSGDWCSAWAPRVNCMRSGRDNGTLMWKRDLYEEFGATRDLFGYSSHPLPYGDRLIVVNGG